MLQIRPGSISEILTKLEAKGLIIRSRDKSDQRKSILELTSEGKKAAENLQEEDRPAMFDALNSQEQGELKKLLKKLLDSWKGQI